MPRTSRKPIPPQLLALGFVAVMAADLPAVAHAKTPRVVVGVAPFSSSSSAEYQWLGSAIANDLSKRLRREKTVAPLGLRQVNAAMRNDRLTRAQLGDPANASRLGRQLGANILVTGSYEALWPDVRVRLAVVDPQRQKNGVLVQREIQGDLSDLPRLNLDIARAVAKAVHLPSLAHPPHAGESLRSQRLLALASTVLSWQSLSPRAADPNATLTLPPSAITEVIKQLEQATTLEPTYAEAWATLGVARALLGTGQIKQAWAHLQKAKQLGSPRAPAVVLGRSFVRMRQGRFDEAEKILQAAIADSPGFLHARGYLGELYNHLGRTREALKVFQDYLAIAPKQPWVMAQIGYTKSRMGDHRGGIADTLRAVGILPRSPSLLLELASRYIDAKKYVGAEDALLRLTSVYPHLPTPHVRLGYVYLLQGKNGKAISSTEKGLKLAKKSKNNRSAAYAHLNLVRAYGRLGRMEDALIHLGASRKGAQISLDELLIDPALAPLRRDPRFAELMR